MARQLRFAALVRVSTEKQEQKGESLATQKASVVRDAEHLGGKIVEWYGGQEHATPGHEKREIDRLLRDAAKGRWDALIVAYADRWSRDNGKSQAGIDVLKANRKRFFVGTTEYNLFIPEHVLFLSMSAAIGQFQAGQQSKKSIETRIKRAKDGDPTSGKLPFGRTFEDGKWGIDKAKHAMVKDIAKRYLAGEPLAKLAREYGVNQPALHKNLMYRCGDTWEQTFDSDELNIHEKVDTPVPRLLPEATIKAMRERAKLNRTYNAVRTPYLLSGHVFCGHCGYAMQAQKNHNGHRYYRHQLRNGAANCTCEPRPWVRADELEEEVVQLLFSQFGNPLALERAIIEAMPNLDMVRTLQKRQQRLKAELEKIGKGRDRILELILGDKLTKEQAEAKLAQVKGTEAALDEEIATVEAQLASVHTPEEIKASAAEVVAMFTGGGPSKERLRKMDELDRIENMTFEDRRALLAEVFEGRAADGSAHGVYVSLPEGQQARRRKRFTFRMRGVAAIDRHTGAVGAECVNDQRSC